MQSTLVIIKPDAVQRGLSGRIIQRFEDKGLFIIGAKLMKIPAELAGKHYSDHAGKPFYDGLVKFMTSSPVWVLAVRGERAIEVVRTLMGTTDGCEAAPGTIRGDFGSSKGFNLVHGSDSEGAASKELGLFFADGELFDATPDRIKWVIED